MKRAMTLVVLVALAASPALAEVRPGGVVGPGDPAGTTQPAHESGTMALAAMGLMVLGVTLRRRRGH